MQQLTVKHFLFLTVVDRISPETILDQSHFTKKYILFCSLVLFGDLQNNVYLF